MTAKRQSPIRIRDAEIHALTAERDRLHITIKQQKKMLAKIHQSVVVALRSATH